MRMHHTSLVASYVYACVCVYVCVCVSVYMCSIFTGFKVGVSQSKGIEISFLKLRNGMEEKWSYIISQIGHIGIALIAKPQTQSGSSFLGLIRPRVVPTEEREERGGLFLQPPSSSGLQWSSPALQLLQASLPPAVIQTPCACNAIRQLHTAVCEIGRAHV